MKNYLKSRHENQKLEDVQNIINNLPMARTNDIVIQELGNEVLVCDLKTQKIFCLNQTAGEVWKLCDGKTEINQIAKLLEKKYHSKVDEDLVWLALEELARENLLSEKVLPQSEFSQLSRREVIRHLKLTSIIALPVISGITMPAAVNALSAPSCQSNADCFPEAPVCRTNPSPSTCVACLENADCTNPGNPICNMTTNTCVACITNMHCTPGSPICNQTSNTCVACLENADCPPGSPTCNTTTNTCV